MLAEAVQYEPDSGSRLSRRFRHSGNYADSIVMTSLAIESVFFFASTGQR